MPCTLTGQAIVCTRRSAPRKAASSSSPLVARSPADPAPSSPFIPGSLALKSKKTWVLDGLPQDRSPIIVVVYGGREWTTDGDRKRIWRVLDKARQKYGIDALLEGKARGVDSVAGQWAERCGLPHIEMGANWKERGKGAGFARNEWMVRCISPNYGIEFAGGEGTLDMRERLMVRGIDIKCAKLAHPFYPDWRPL